MMVQNGCEHINKKPSCMVLRAPGAALPALGMNFNALKRSFCFGLLASVHVRDHVRAVVREKLQRSTTANSIVPCSTFFAAHHRVSKKEFEWLRQEQFTTFQDITNGYFMSSGLDYKVILFLRDIRRVLSCVF
jgi:hypothetical protein